jgi:hypothetical protein
MLVACIRLKFTVRKIRKCEAANWQKSWQSSGEHWDSIVPTIVQCVVEVDPAIGAYPNRHDNVDVRWLSTLFAKDPKGTPEHFIGLPETTYVHASLEMRCGVAAVSKNLLGQLIILIFFVPRTPLPACHSPSSALLMT